MRRLLALGLTVAFAATLPAAATARGDDRDHGVDHIVVIYQENHSFDNLYGGWEGVDGLAGAPYQRTIQVNQAGSSWACLDQLDVNLVPSVAHPAVCTDATTATSFTSRFVNQPFTIDASIPASATTCPAPGVFAPNGVLDGTGLPGGCTRDIVHRFYQEQYQLDGGRMDRYTTGSDAAGLTQGVYDTTALPIYQYLHAPGHPKYAIEDAFFQGSFGGSFLNHQWLIAARTPAFLGADHSGGANDLHSIVDTNGFPNATYPLYTPTVTGVKDGALTAACGPATPVRLLCGDYAINTIQPFSQPYSPGTATARRLPALTNPTIGDELSHAGVDWAWYSGGWSNADGRVGAPGWTNGTGPTCSDPAALATATYPNCADKLFQFHHQAFNYFANYAPATTARAKHLLDEQQFMTAASSSTSHCDLKPVSFVKPLGNENEHPGYASESNGNQHLVDLISSIEGGACARNTMIIVTYDEFGGTWDHVPPPGQGHTTSGPHDQSGPGTRVPALLIAPFLSRASSVDDTSHDTTSILATIEHRFHLDPLSSRDRAVRDLFSDGHRPGD